LVLAVLISACASVPWKRQAVVSYEGLAKTLEIVQKNSMLFRDSGTITQEQYAKIGLIYKPAKKLAAETKAALDLAIDAANTVKEDSYMEDYQKLLAQFKTLFYNLLDLALDFGVLSRSEHSIYKEM